ncbi:Retinoblastoma-related protein [Platanthera zijinensis]|uniref:Retinoblastoma-related protein n=1 Tax=Platanthera zijinensis TaxID=2320716 RepID=A0AAP0FVZ7_9ASPA
MEDDGDAMEARFANICKSGLSLDQSTVRQAMVLFRESKHNLLANISTIGSGSLFQHGIRARFPVPAVSHFLTAQTAFLPCPQTALRPLLLSQLLSAGSSSPSLLAGLPAVETEKSVHEEFDPWGRGDRTLTSLPTSPNDKGKGTETDPRLQHGGPTTHPEDLRALPLLSQVLKLRYLRKR